MHDEELMRVWNSPAAKDIVHYTMDDKQNCIRVVAVEERHVWYMLSGTGYKVVSLKEWTAAFFDMTDARVSRAE